jgi:hypothetical protein
MRIGYYTPNYPGISQDGGIGTYTRALGIAMAELGHEIHVLTLGSSNLLRDKNITVHCTQVDHVPLINRLLPGAIPCWRIGQDMRSLVKRYSLDLVEFPNWEGFGLWFQLRSNTPTVVRLHTSSYETQFIDKLPSSRRLRWDVKREHWQCRRAAALVTHSDAHRCLMAKELGCPPGSIELIPHGVHVYRDYSRPVRPAGPPTIVYLGRLEKRKGTIDLLQAIPQVLKSFPEARFVLIGQDRAHCPGGRTHAQYLQEEFPSEVRQQVTLAGRLPDDQVDHWLQTADVFVAPSHYESFGLIFPEAMRWGTPVIGTRTGGIPEIIQDGVTGLLVDIERPM